MSQSESSHDENGHHGPVFDTSNAEGRMNWVFYDFWPVMIWVAVLALMCALPIIMSGALHNPFSSADVVWWGYGLLILLMFFFALAIFIVIPRFVGVYVLLVSIYALVMAEQFKAWHVSGMPWGSSIAILFLSYMLVGNLVFMQADRPEKKKCRLKR